jgi:hypothetical protein
MPSEINPLKTKDAIASIGSGSVNISLSYPCHSARNCWAPRNMEAFLERKERIQTKRQQKQKVFYPNPKIHNEDIRYDPPNPMT